MPTPPASGYTHPCSASALAAGSTPYSRASGIDYLAEYATRYNTVEVDQWFWAMPEPATAAQYASVTPADFRFTVKLPNMLTLTHLYPTKAEPALRPNPQFLPVPLFQDVLARLPAPSREDRHAHAPARIPQQREDEFAGHIP
jgi:hypothetical protein